MMKSTIAPLLAALLVSTDLALAVINQANSQANNETTLTASSTDLATNGSITLSSGSVYGINDGNPAELTSGLTGINEGLYHSSGTNGTHFPAEYTISLDTATNPAGYDITSIATFAGWNTNGQTLANQKYEIFVNTTTSSSFVSLGIFEYTPFSTTSGASGTKITLTDSTGTIAYGVTSVRIRVLDHGTHTGRAQGTVYKEFDILGTPTSTIDKNMGDIWCIGDSITQSNLDGDGNGSPRKSLYDLLTADGYSFTFTGHWNVNSDGLPSTGSNPGSNLYHYHSGVSGSTIGSNSNGRTNMTASIPSWWNTARLATDKPEIILIMLGTNDIDLNDDITNAPARMKNLVNTVLNQPGADTDPPSIFVAKIPPNLGSANKDNNVVAYNDGLATIVQELQTEGKDVTLVDNYTPIKANTGALMRDSLHTNTAGNNVLAQQWFNAIEAKLNNSGNPNNPPPSNNEYRFVRLTALSEVNGQAWASSSDINLVGQNENLINRSNWNVSASSQETAEEDGRATRANDNDLSTIWHTQWSGDDIPPHPHTFTIDLRTPTALSELRQRPRSDSPNGRIADYQVHGSNDNISWTLLDEGTWQDSTTEQIATFENSNSQPPAGITAYYSFNNSSNIGNDDSGNGFNLTQTAVSHTNTGQSEGGAAFTTNDSRFNHNGITLGENWTVSAWYEGLDTDGWRTLFRGNYNWLIIGSRTSNAVGLFYSGFKPSGHNLTPQDGVWHMITATGTPAGITYYLDGQPIGSVTGHFTNVVIRSIGNNRGGGQRFADTIDEVYLYDRTLTAAEVTDLHSASNGNFSGVSGSSVQSSFFLSNAADTEITSIEGIVETPPTSGLLDLNLRATPTLTPREYRLLHSPGIDQQIDPTIAYQWSIDMLNWHSADGVSQAADGTTVEASARLVNGEVEVTATSSKKCECLMFRASRNTPSLR